MKNSDSIISKRKTQTREKAQTGLKLRQVSKLRRIQSSEYLPNVTTHWFNNTPETQTQSVNLRPSFQRSKLRIFISFKALYEQEQKPL
ncbi:hypothetical protein HanHA300_Chr09g0313591 [Helianthus annuus]|nr:hypothetical protein HanHA300_Chr09g0313591 [Helianthus annuus]KAJ0541958.1 hypothetical protein HanHA89_Chr09g0334481 [Helianthus annuus]KAJ0707026.1 hypothetical protein HanLR1_Chr09g0313851 [Helianthus annuus]